MVRMPPSAPYAVLFSLLLFLPVLLLLLVTVPCLGSLCVSMLWDWLADPSLGLGGSCAWAFGPLPAAAVLFALGLAGYWLAGRSDPRRIHWFAVWAMFTLCAFPVAWYRIILVTSIGASETPPMEFLGITALLALAAITLGQPLIVLWLFMVNRLWRGFGRRQETPG